MPELFNRVRMTVSGTPGTGNVTLSTAVNGRQSFADAGVTDGDEVRVVFEDTGDAWEISTVTYNSTGPALDSRSLLESSTGSLLSLTSDAEVFVDAAAGDVITPDGTQTLTNKTINPASNTIDGDVLDITFTPSNYTPDATPAEASDVDDLAAHLKGLDTAIGNAGGGGLVFIASTDISNDATVDFTAFDSGSYDSYVFVFQNVLPATDNVTLYVRTSTNGGSTYDASSGNYAYISAGTAAFEGADYRQTNTWAGNVAQIVAGTNEDITGITNNTGKGLSGEVRILGPHLASDTVVTFQLSGEVIGDSADTHGYLLGSGVRLSAADVDAIRFLFSSGNLASGTITMYGMVNA